MPRGSDICQHFNRTLLKHYRKQKHKTRKAFADKVGVSIRTVQAWELGEKKPSLKNLNKIADALEIDPEDMLNETGTHIWQRWEGHVLDYVISPPEVKKQTKTEVTVEGKKGSQKQSKTDTERELKLTERGAIELTEKLGIFEEVSNNMPNSEENADSKSKSECIQKIMFDPRYFEDDDGDDDDDDDE